MTYRYRCIAASEIGFVQQLACNYLPHGYWFYVMGRVPEGKDARAVDEKLLEKYRIAVSRQTRARRKLRGEANVHYLRRENLFVLVATHGKHRFFEEEAGNIRDAREVPIKFAGYSLTCKRGNFKQKREGQERAERDDKFRVRVQVSREVYLDWRAYFVDRARFCSAERLAQELYVFPYEPYAPVRKQMLSILRLVNKVRRQRGSPKLEPSVIRYRRRIVKPFELTDGEALEAVPAKEAVGS